MADPKGKSETPNNEIKNEYFGAMQGTELIPYLNSKATEYYDFAMRYKFLDRWRRSYLAYYGMSQAGTDTTKLNQAGTNGEEYILKVNDYRSLLQGLLTMTTANRPALQPKAMNTDSKSMNQTVLARTVLDYYMTEKHLEATIKDTVEFALFAAEGFLVLRWNATAGDIYQVDPSSGAAIYDGDLEFRAFHPIDVVRECWAENAKQTWFIVREFRNKWDLGVKYPELADQITKITDSSDFMKRYSNIQYNAHTEVDHVPVWTFFHEKSETLPNGRMVEYLGDDIILSDGPLPYKNLPVYQLKAQPWHGTPFGYTVAYDLMGIQQNLDALNSIVATNQMNYGVQNILLPRGGEYNVTQLAQGLNGIDYDPKIGEPKPLNLLQTPEEIVKNIERLEKKQETLSGVNATARGQVDRDMSGAALALLAAQSVQFNGGLEQAYNFLLESVGTGVIEIIQEYATTPRIISIAGKSNRSRVKEFKGDDLNGISRVSVEQVNPVSKTAAGRLSMAQDMLKSNLIQTPQHYFEVVTTGNLESLYEHENSQMLLIRSENEDLSEGVAVTAILTDRHKLHIEEHSTVLDSPEARQDPKIIQAVTQHLQDHINLLKNTDPNLLNLLGEQSLAAPPGQGQAPGAPLPPGPLHPPGPVMPQMASPTNPAQQEAMGIKGPNMPGLPKGTPAGAQDAYAAIKSNTGK
jgi:hypothetical protein